MTPLFIDFETQSGVDLKEVGGRKYARHSSTRVLCLCALYDDERITLYDDFGRITKYCDRPVAAHNATGFDRFIWDRFVGTSVDWIDTLSLSRAAGLPGSLDDLGLWFEGRGKDSAKSLLKKCMKLEWDGTKWFNKWTKPGAVEAIARYCMRDVELLRTVWLAVKDHPSRDPGAEAINIEINDRGVQFDEELASRIAEISTQIVGVSGEEIERITGGRIRRTDLRRTAYIGEWLREQGVELPDLRRSTVESFLASDDDTLVPPLVRRVMRLRNAALRITGAKLERASAMAIGGRLHDLHTYHTAHTGRFSSRGMQIHNLPRGVEGLDPTLCENLTFERVTAEADRLGKSPDDILSSLIRPTLVAKEGHRLAIADFAAIENRVLGWLGGEQSILDVFRNALDPYKDMASSIFGVAYEDVTKVQRQAGKVAVLGCGYQMGAKKLEMFAGLIGADLSAAGVTADEIVQKWRDRYPRIAGVRDGEWEGRPVRRGGLWKDLQNAWTMVANGAAIMCEVGCLRLFQYRGAVVMRLPSGRGITYRKARVEDRVTQYGVRPTCVFTGARGDEMTYGGKLTENAVQAIARDILVDAMKKTPDIVLHVHDEIVCEVLYSMAEERLAQLIETMSTAPEWAPGLPLKAEGHISKRYTK